MTNQGKDSTEALQETIERYNDAWNRHDLDAIHGNARAGHGLREPHGG
jgi:hypothetical protein